MIKKTIVIGVAVVLLVGLIGGTTIWSYISTAGTEISDKFDDMMPVEFELKRARQLLADLTPEIKSNMHTIARAEMKVKEMDEKIGSAEERLAKSESHILRLTSDLESANSQFIYASKTYSRDQVKTDLASRFQRHTVSEATLASWKTQRNARNTALTAARNRFKATLDAKRELETQVELLEAKWAEVQAQKAESKYQIDDTQLGAVKELVNRLDSRIKVEQNLIAVEGDAMGEIPLDDDESVTESDIVTDVRAHFNKTSDSDSSTADVDPSTEFLETGI